MRGATRRLRKFLGLPPAERRLVVQATVALALTTLGLRFLSLENLLAIMARGTRRARPGNGRGGSFPARAGWAVATASAFIPGATCLPRALAVQLLLGRRGYVSRLRIGMARGVEGSLEGHAWVEHRGKPILDNGFQPEIVLPGRGGRGRNG